MTKQFKKIIKELRNQKGLTQEGLAQEMGVSKSTIDMWETDSIIYQSAMSIAQEFTSLLALIKARAEQV